MTKRRKKTAIALADTGVASRSPDETEYHQPSQWHEDIDWKPENLSAALQMADAGSLYQAAILCEDMQQDDRIRGVLSTRVNALTGCEIKWGAGNDAIQAAIVLDWPIASGAGEIGKLYRWGFQLGVGIAENLWVSRHKRWVPKLKVWHPKWLSYNYSIRKWQLQTSDGLITIEPDDPHWTMFLPYGTERPWAEGTWRASAIYWVGKRYAWRDWNRHNELHGSGIIVGKTPVTADKPIKDRFWAQLQGIARNAKIQIPDGFGLEILEAKARTWETFPEAMRMADTAQSIIHLGQNLTTEVNGGSFAAAMVHGGVRQDFLENDAIEEREWVSQGHLTRSPIQWWALFNFGNAELAPIPMRDIAPPEDLAKKVETQGKTADSVAKWIELGIAVDIKETAKAVGVVIDETMAAPVDVSKGEIFKYHLDYGVFSKNEIRASRGLPPVTGGDKPPQPFDNAPAEVSKTVLSEQVKLASGDTIPATSGFVQGQKYADAVADDAAKQWAKAFAPTVEEILALIDSIEDKPGWEDVLRSKLVDLAKDSSQSLEDVTEKALILAELAGRYAVLEDL